MKKFGLFLQELGDRLVVHVGSADGGGAVVDPDHGSFDLDLGVDELEALEAHLGRAVRAVRVRLRHLELGDRGQVELDVGAFGNLGGWAFELAFLTSGGQEQDCTKGD